MNQRKDSSARPNLWATMPHLKSTDQGQTQLPELVKEVHRAISTGYGSVHSRGESHVDGFLIRCLDKFDHGPFEETDKAACEFGPNIAMQVDLDILFRDHELHIYGLNGGECAPIKEFLCGEADADLEFQTLKVNVSMAFSLDEALLKFEVATVEGS